MARRPRPAQPGGATRRAALALLAASPALAAVPGPPRLRRGINLHHILNWPDTVLRDGQRDYVWPPFAGERHRIADAELAHLRAAGFDFLRVTLDPALVMSAGEARWPALGDHVTALLERLVGARFAVVLDLHPVAVQPALGPDVLARDAAAFARYADAVGRVAALLARLPGPVVFELMNEPRLPAADAPRWQGMLEILHARARTAARDLPLVLTGTPWSDAAALMRLDTAPFRGSAVLYTFHAYEPHAYTHQGVRGDEARGIRGLAWPVTTAGVAVAIADGAEPGTRRVLDRLARAPHGPEDVDRDFRRLADWARARGIAPERMLLGEFGCVEAARGMAVPGRLDWLATVRRAAEANGFPWAYWAYRGEGGMTLVSDAGTIDPALLTALGLSSA